MDNTFSLLAAGFVLAKPLKPEQYKEEIIYELERLGRLIITRKRDGWKIFAQKQRGIWRLFTDGLREMTVQLPSVTKYLQTFSLPDDTLLVGEGVVHSEAGELLENATRIFGSGAENSLSLQNTLVAKYRLFDVVYFGGALMVKKGGLPYRSRLNLIEEIFPANEDAIVAPVERLTLSFDQAKELVRKNKWEGLVLYADDFESSFRQDGKDPERTKGAYKWKPIFEDDFVAYKPVFATDGHLKEILIAQRDVATGEWIDCGKCGTFSRKTREEFATATYPFVVRIVYELRFPTAKLRNKVFDGVRPDKIPNQCTFDSSPYPKAVKLGPIIGEN